MPTPSDDTLQLPSQSFERSTHTTCPPDFDRLEDWGDLELSHLIAEDGSSDNSLLQRSTRLPRDAETSCLMEDVKDQDPQSKMDDGEKYLQSIDGSSPITVQAESKDSREYLSPSPVPSVRPITYPSSSSYEFSSVRVCVVLTYCNKYTKSIS